ATNCRAIAVPDKAGKMKAQQLIPDWESLPLWKDDQQFSSFANVDGGTFNNEPLDVVRLAMAGLNGTNPRSPSEAKRAVVLIDPFSDAEKLGTPDTGKLTSMIGPILGALIQQPRFKPADLALAYNEGTYSRFLIAPTRQGASRKYIGKDAIASGALGGFFGFLDGKLLVHDYLLGRVNAHSFLRKHFMLPESAANPLFRDPWWTESRRQKYGVRDADGNRFLPIIPLMDDLRDRRLETAPWPSSLAMPAGFEAAVEARLDSIYAKLKAQLAPSSWVKKMAMEAYLWSGWRAYARGALKDVIIGKFKAGLDDLRKHE
ncbi:MAG TPA: hypothetical protein VEC60_05820, partial [Reyranella sp.]|nr:hypothetical protein [Reyranella sp.]